MSGGALEVRQRIVPSLQYEDVGAAADWLVETFGFHEIVADRMTDDAGRVWHTAVEMNGGHVMLGTTPGYQAPKRHGHVGSWTLVYVDDVDGHHEHAARCGAEVLDAPVDRFWGDRVYAVADLEGQRWSFAQRLREVAPEDYAPSDDDVKRHTG